MPLMYSIILQEVKPFLHYNIHYDHLYRMKIIPYFLQVIILLNFLESNIKFKYYSVFPPNQNTYRYLDVAYLYLKRKLELVNLIIRRTLLKLHPQLH